MSVLTLLNAFRATAARCTCCGSDDYYPDPGPVAALGAVFSLSRHSCRRCRATFWLRTTLPSRLGPPPDPDDADTARDPDDPESDEAAEREWPDPAEIDHALARSDAARAEPPPIESLDGSTAIGGATPADLSALDDDIARLRRPPKRRRRASRAKRGNSTESSE